MRITASFVVAAAVALLHETPARACGGLFCSSQTRIPVDQTAERILFEVNDDQSVTATVEVSYFGDAASFSWIIPVPETPTSVDVASPSVLLLLDTATVPRILPRPTFCSTAPPSGGPSDGGFAGGFADAGAAGDGGTVVVVEPLPNVGPYGEIVVVSSDDPVALTTWLNDNGYLVTPAMEPFIAAYVAEGQKFLAVQLQPQAGIDDIVPLRFTCPGAGPHIPLRMTAIASRPELSVVAFIAGAGRYKSTEFRMITIDPADVRLDRNGRYNYIPLVSWLVDEEGGKAFVTERAQSAAAIQNLVASTFLNTADVEAARADLNAILGRRAFVTRMYTRLNAEEMDVDPAFAIDVDAPQVSGTLDLSTQPPLDVCSGDTLGACGSMYCGMDASCAVASDGSESCVCAEGQTARRIAGPFGETVFCAASSTDVLGDAPPDGGPSVCDLFTCGPLGTCVAVNGAPTCRCDSGTAARVDLQQAQGVRCSPIVGTAFPATTIQTGNVIPGPPRPDGGPAATDAGFVFADGGFVFADGGFVMTDAGPVPADGGLVAVDGGLVPADAGFSDDAGAPTDEDAGGDDVSGGGLPPNYRADRGGAFCSCTASSSGRVPAGVALLVVAVAMRRRRR